jgi:hypothetical protein
MTSLLKNHYQGGNIRLTCTATESTFSINIRSTAPATPLGAVWRSVSPSLLVLQG